MSYNVIEVSRHVYTNVMYFPEIKVRKKRLHHYKNILLQLNKEDSKFVLKRLESESDYVQLILLHIL
jgi:hypothetical protein